MKLGRGARRLIYLVIVALAAWWVDQAVQEDGGPPPVDAPAQSTRTDPGPRPSNPSAGEAVLAEAWRNRRSGVVVEVAGSVQRQLSDDNEGSRHQRFILELAGGQTLLVAHNIDLAPRVPLQAGDRLELRGQYEWNERGGVLHWTHHDPRGGRPGGWIRHDGETYR